MSGLCALTGKRSDNSDQYIRADDLTDTIATIDLLHLLAHEGKLYNVSGKIASIAAAASMDFIGITPANGECHIGSLSIDSSGAPVDIFLYEAPTVTANGVAITPRNINRRYADNSFMGVYGGPTVTAVGTQLQYTMLTGSRQRGGVGEGKWVDIITKLSTIYLFRITNTGTGAISIGYDMTWAEL